MRTLRVTLACLTLVACAVAHPPTSPVTPPDSIPSDTSKLKDPTVDLYNNSADRAYFYWRNGAAVLGADTVPAFTHRCEAFTAVADSAYWQVIDTAVYGPASGAWAEQHTNYFDPTTRPAWNILVSEDRSGVSIIAKDTTAECTP